MVKAKKTTVIWDSKVKGLHTRCYPTGRKCYFLYYRTADQMQRRPKLGDSEDITLTVARELALKLRQKLAKEKLKRLLN